MKSVQIRTRKNSVFGHFLSNEGHSDYLKTCKRKDNQIPKINKIYEKNFNIFRISKNVILHRRPNGLYKCPNKLCKVYKINLQLLTSNS